MKYIPSLLAPFFSQGYNIKLINPQTYSWDYPLAYNDGTKRFQFVYLGEETLANGKDYLFIRSFVGNFTEQLNPIVLLREAEFCNQSCVCIKTYPGADGKSVEGVYVQSMLPATIATQDAKAFEDVVHEVANRADFIEKRYLNVDN